MTVVSAFISATGYESSGKLNKFSDILVKTISIPSDAGFLAHSKYPPAEVVRLH